MHAARFADLAAPSYSLPAVVPGKDWGTGTPGTTATITKGVTGYAAFSGEIVQRNVATYGGQFGVNVALR
jgi:outer membrane lipase/esterase